MTVNDSDRAMFLNYLYFRSKECNNNIKRCKILWSNYSWRRTARRFIIIILIVYNTVSDSLAKHINQYDRRERYMKGEYILYNYIIDESSTEIYNFFYYYCWLLILLTWPFVVSNKLFYRMSNHIRTKFLIYEMWNLSF